MRCGLVTKGCWNPSTAATWRRGRTARPRRRTSFPGALTECGVGTLFYSTIYAYNLKQFPGAKPSTIGDFFDLEKFPGRRGMRRTPHVNLEFALMADGVPLQRVYAVLDTQEGLDRAFRKLDSIKDHIVWWEAGAQPPQMLADGEVAMTTAYNGRIFNAQVLENQPFAIVWDGQLLDMGQMVIVSGTPESGSGAEIPLLRHQGRVPGGGRPLYLLQPCPAIGNGADLNPPGEGGGHEAAHAHHP